MASQIEDRNFVWPEEVRRMCESSAASFNVSPVVHIDDFIFRFIFDNPVFKSKSKAVNYYFSDGNNSAKKVKDALSEWLLPSESKLKILEFASGYGAVTRHAKGLLQPHELCSCDIHKEAVEFISKELGVEAVESSETPEELELPEKYDLIFVLSFFSHMPDLTWGRWLKRLYEGLTSGGVLLFTTHGNESMKYFPKARLDSSGYWFEMSSEQKDLDVSSYGQTITSKYYVDAQIKQLSDVQVLEYKKAGWWGHQDIYVLRKTSA